MRGTFWVLSWALTGLQSRHVMLTSARMDLSRWAPAAVSKQWTGSTGVFNGVSMQENAIFFSKSSMRLSATAPPCRKSGSAAAPLSSGVVMRKTETGETRTHRDMCGINGFPLSNLEFLPAKSIHSITCEKVVHFGILLSHVGRTYLSREYSASIGQFFSVVLTFLAYIIKYWY